MNRPLAALGFALALALLAAACQREAEPASTDPAAATPDASESASDPASAPPAPAPMPADAPKPDDVFSAAALAGTYEGEGRLTLVADGTYTFTLGEASDDGTWGMDDGDPKRLRFDPNSKSLQDHVLEVVSNDELKPTAANGSGMASGASFKRIATP